MQRKYAAICISGCFALCVGYVMQAYATDVYRLPYRKSEYCSKNSQGKEECHFPEKSSLEFASCGKQGDSIYCTNQAGEPITGEVVSYGNEFVSNRYEFKDGYLDGIRTVYDRNGYVTAKMPYVQGKLTGVVEEFGRDGKVTSRVHYEDGVKEGVAEYISKDMTLKNIYVGDKVNGEAQIWGNKDKKKIYDILMSDNYVKKLKYYHYIAADGSCCTYTAGDEERADLNFHVQEIEVPEILRDAINVGCAELQSKFTCNPFPVMLKASDSSCKGWAKQHKDEILKLQKQYKCQPNK